MCTNYNPEYCTQRYRAFSCSVHPLLAKPQGKINFLDHVTPYHICQILIEGIGVRAYCTVLAPLDVRVQHPACCQRRWPPLQQGHHTALQREVSGSPATGSHLFSNPVTFIAPSWIHSVLYLAHA